jgi:hypothetical protein
MSFPFLRIGGVWLFSGWPDVLFILMVAILVVVFFFGVMSHFSGGDR